MPTLGVEQKQLLVHYPDDGDYPWHHRLLLIPLGEPSWIWAATPGYGAERADVDKLRVVLPARASAFPARYVDEIYAFAPVSPAILNKLLSEARSLAAVLGVTLPANAAVLSHVIWRISDTSHPDFGEEIPAGALGVWPTRGRCLRRSCLYRRWVDNGRPRVWRARSGAVCPQVLFMCW